MERIGILLAGKKVLLTVVIGLFSVVSLNADYKLVLTDEAGTQIEECIKSYSFSNNLESIAKQKGVANDVYSDEEVMTNKVYFGKPVYRMVTTIPTLTVSNGWQKAKYTKVPENMETFISAKFVGTELMGITRDKLDGKTDIWKIVYTLEAKEIGYSIGSKRIGAFSGHKVVLEYTKTTDIVNTSPNKFQSYLIYKLSSSTNDEVITKDMKNLGVQILEDYIYDASTSSCTKK